MAVSLDSLSVTRPAASLTQAQAHPPAQPAPERRFAALFSLYSEDNRPGLVPYGVALDAPPAAAANDPKVEMDRWQPRADRPSEPESTLGLGDLIDALNPLHHIPGVGTLYRKVTGDEIAPAAKVVGGTLYGGPIGLVSGLVNAVAEQVNGAALDETALAYMFGDDEGAAPTSAPTSVAAGNDPRQATEQAVAANDEPAPAAHRAAVLTGSDALAAFARDIGRADHPPASLASADPHATEPQAASALPARAFPAQMMLGLDKYRQMAVERGGPGMPAVPTVDRRL